MPIYKITNTKTGEFYIGKTTLSIEQRFSDHKYSSRYYDTHLYRAFKKYGIEVFCIEAIDACPDDLLNEREIEWIKTLSPHYNMTSGGDGGTTHHLQTWKDGMAQRRSYAGKNNPMYGKQSAFRGRTHKQESIALMSKSKRLQWDKMTPEERLERGKQVSGKKNGMYGKTPKNAVKYEIDEKVYESLSAASRATGLSAYLVKRKGKKIHDEG